MFKAFDHSTRVYLTAPVGGVIGGKFYKFGALFGCAVASAPAGKQFTLDRDGIWTVKVEAVAADIAPGDQIFWLAGRADAEFSNESAAGAILVGVALGTVQTGDTNEIDVVISPFPLTISAEALEDAGGADA